MRNHFTHSSHQNANQAASLASAATQYDCILQLAAILALFTPSPLHRLAQTSTHTGEAPLSVTNAAHIKKAMSSDVIQSISLPSSQRCCCLQPNPPPNPCNASPKKDAHDLHVHRLLPSPHAEVHKTMKCNRNRQRMDQETGNQQGSMEARSLKTTGLLACAPQAPRPT